MTATKTTDGHNGGIAAPARKTAKPRKSVPSLDRIPSSGGGRGVVDQLLAGPSRQLVDLPVAMLVPHPDNLRDDVGDLTEMVAEMARIGVLEPLLVATAEAFTATRTSDDDAERVVSGQYVILAGHRRHAAAMKAGLDVVPCIVRDDLAGDGNAVVTMLLENLHREGLRPVEEARGYRLLEDLGKSQTQIAELVGCTQANVSKKLALLKLPAEIQADVGGRDGAITIEEAAQLAKYGDEPDVIKAAQARPTWQTIDQVADKVRRDRSRKAKVEEKKDEYRARGTTRFVDWPTYGMATSLERRMQPHATGPMKVSDLKACGVDVRDHAALTCHAVAVGYEGGWSTALKTAIVCTKPTVHGAAIVKKQESAEARAAREAEKARERAAARVEMARAVLAGKPGRDLTELVETLLLARMLRGFNRDHEITPLAAMLGVAPPDDNRRSFVVVDEITALAEQNAAGRARVLAALALAIAEAGIDAPYNRDDWAAGRYLRWLQSQGHELAGDERRLVQAATS